MPVCCGLYRVMPGRRRHGEDQRWMILLCRTSAGPVSHLLSRALRSLGEPCSLMLQLGLRLASIRTLERAFPPGRLRPWGFGRGRPLSQRAGRHGPGRMLSVESRRPNWSPWHWAETGAIRWLRPLVGSLLRRPPANFWVRCVIDSFLVLVTPRGGFLWSSLLW